MTIKIGDALPNVTLKRLGENGMEDLIFGDYIKGKKIVLFAGRFGARLFSIKQA